MTDILQKLFPGEIHLRGGRTAQQADLGAYLIDYIANGPELVISFESAWDKTNRADHARDPEALSVLLRHGYSVLGIKARQTDWYRDPVIHQWFRAPELQRFFDQFSRIVFFGLSMGAFGALVFSQVRPGSLVVASNPQYTLDPKLVPWEHRWPVGQKQDWTGDFADSIAAVPIASKVYLTYDPLHLKDRRHAAPLAHGNVVDLKTPLLGHAAPIWLLQLGILEETTVRSLAGTLTGEAFAKLLRQRRGIARYYLAGAEQATRKSFSDKLLQAGLQKFPDDPALYARGVQRYFELGQYKKCVALYDNCFFAAAMLPRSERAQANAAIGMAMCRLRLPKERIEPLIEAVEYASKNPRELVLSARFLNEAGAHADAERAALAALTLAPTSEFARKQLALARKANTKPRK